MSVAPAERPSWDWAALAVEDLPEVLAIEEAAHLYPWSEAVFEECLRAGYRLDGAFRHGELVGYSVVMAVLDEWHLLNLCVEPTIQRSGAGRFLLERVIASARAAEASCVLLEVRAGNHAAIGLYESAGFADIGHRKAYYPAPSGREDARVMRRLLS
ncbi:ribosomal protein S18-alanine N-acetyltransferase [Guyparkeria hydrothermalis]|uniref:ribosomal protein S18-alanine N-acetyltransferase n=1 Tax=Guyparkeria hydrothermalis TaxID=923 RepID=UPI0020211BF7|nr:ribosomal protein S18-alanine N-acetyltransferase [Guyparkeria hydrothermalis]MCL7745368.1 ribosomal protein S18-alanine N-acetyltransferase [Guyparkeria hydrothermalis]